VRRRLEQDGTSGSSGCTGRRRRLQGKVQQQQQREKSEPQREQGKGPSRRRQQGKAAADREDDSLVRSGDWICGGGGFGLESQGCGGRKPSPTLPFTVVSWATTQMEKTAHAPFTTRQGPTPPFTTRQGPNAPINHQTRPIHDFAVSLLYYCEFNCKRIIIFIDNSNF
jgi:hypothetical protein